MRLQTRRIRKIKLANRIVTKDNEGVPQVSYGTPQQFKCEMWPAQSNLQVMTYGDRVKRIQNVKLQGSYTVNSDESYTFAAEQRLATQDGTQINDHDGSDIWRSEEYTLREGDGVFVNRDDEPDYKVISISPYHPLQMEIEKL